MTDDIPQWAVRRACFLAESVGMPSEGVAPNGPYTGPLVNAFARYIAAHEEPPVDPLLLEARELAAASAEKLYHPRVSDIRAGSVDDDHTFGVPLALAALKRGMELARTQSGSAEHD